MNHNFEKRGLFVEWSCPNWHCCGNRRYCPQEPEGITSWQSPLLHDPSDWGLRFSSFQFSLLLLNSHHQAQSRQLGPLQCLEIVPLSSDTDAETEHQPRARGCWDRMLPARGAKTCSFALHSPAHNLPSKKRFHFY